MYNDFSIGCVYNGDNQNDISRAIGFYEKKKLSTRTDEPDEQEGGGIIAEIGRRAGEIQSAVQQGRGEVMAVETSGAPVASSMPAEASGPGLVCGSNGKSGQGLSLPGDGMLPGDMLKLKLLKKELKKKQSQFTSKAGEYRGGGLSLPGGGIGRRSNTEPIFGQGLSGQGLSLPGGGATSIIKNKVADAITGIMLPTLQKQIFGQGLMDAPISQKIHKLLKLKYNNILPKGDIKSVSRYLKPMAIASGEVILPILSHLAGNGMSGAGFKKLKTKLSTEITNALRNMVKVGKSGQGGEGFLGKDKYWWREFGKGFSKGFKSVVKPGAKVLAAASPFLGVPELAPALVALSEVL